MSRLTRELHRLFPNAEAPRLAPGGPADAAAQAESDSVQALGLELARPAQWPWLARVWQGVQADLGLPAPAIAINGVDGLQLWFSLQQPVAAGRGMAFLEGLRQRYLTEVPAGRVRLLTVCPPVPAQQADTGNWSAFVAPDLAPIFDEAPWLDIPPGEDGQAELLARVQGLQPSAFDAALQAVQAQEQAAQPQSPAEAAKAQDAGGRRPSEADTAARDLSPAQHAAQAFLLSVMNDGAAPLALRIEAAKALLRRAAPD